MRAMKMKRLVGGGLAAVLVAAVGCSKPKPAVPATQPAKGQEKEKGPPAYSAALDGEFRELFRTLDAMVEDTRLPEALMLCAQKQTYFARHPEIRKLREMRSDLRELKMKARGLSTEISRLGHKEDAVARIGARKLRVAGKVGRLFLRKAVRTADERTALRAAKELVAQGDKKLAAALLFRITAAPKAELAAKLTALLGDAAADMDDATVAKLFQIGRTDSDTQESVLKLLVGVLHARIAAAEQAGDAAQPISPGLPAYLHEMAQITTDRIQRALVGAVAAYFEKGCGGKEAKFDAAVGEEEGIFFHREYVKRRLDSPNTEVRAWARELAPKLGL